MKIAFFHELHAGGARRGSNEFARQLKKNHTVDLYLVEENYNKSEEKFYSKIFHSYFLPKNWKGKNWRAKINKDSLELIRLSKLHKKIAIEIDKNEYDKVLVFPSQFTQAPFILKYLKTKKIYFVMEPLRLVYDPRVKIPKGLDLMRSNYEKFNRKIRKIIDAENLSKADLYIAPSKYIKELAKKTYEIKTEVGYLGVDVNFFTPANKKRDIDLLFVGSQDPLNGYLFFKEVLRDLKRKVKVREVLFEKEWLNDVQIRDLYRRSKILIAVSRDEPQGIIPLEAMACGCVVLALDEAGYKETVADGKSGYLLPLDSKKFARKVDELIGSKTLLKNMSDFCVKYVRDFWSWEKVGKNLEKILKSN